jgi:hypothetical protein
MAAVQTDLLLPSICQLLTAWPLVLQRFYLHLQHLDPRLRYLLPPAMPRYFRLAFFAACRKQAIVADGPGLGRLGKRLCANGFDWTDVDTLVAAWLATLEDVLGEQFRAEVREEWVRLYRTLRAQSSDRSDPL